MAEGIYKKHKNDIRARISKEGDTALHIAAAAEQIDFLKKLVDNINKEDLATTNNAGNTAFCLAAVSGNVELAQVMMNKMKKEDLTTKKGAGKTAYCLSVESQKVELPSMIEESTNLAYVLDSLINNGLYDVALDLLEKHSELAVVVMEMRRQHCLPWLERLLPLKFSKDSGNNMSICVKSPLTFDIFSMP
ncbi:hypothetical protein Pint_12315 [Pistacia integerrima]|uniref:Uncharacterized protein n=1 Tax=Pistacia integerrima TaxID=434235 RepID=A0ACC0XJP6_9ROSI|nr:hypothetical protein Pint_12315 [Pistacia integerrima]